MTRRRPRPPGSRPDRGGDPAAWLVYIFTQGAFTDWYPYPFLDVTELGFGTAVRNAALVLVLGAALAAVLKLLDAKLPVLLGLLRRR